MGGKASHIANKFSQYVYGSTDTDSTNAAVARKRFKVSPFVLKRTGSMYFDEDGHLAHEFYVEIPASSGKMKARMMKIHRNLKPQGDVELEIPRLHVDLPVVMCQI